MKIRYFTETESNANFVSRNTWTDIDSYPATCGAGNYVSAIGDTLTCSVPTDTNTNANTDCAGTTTYLDGEGNCDSLVLSESVKGNNTGWKMEAGFITTNASGNAYYITQTISTIISYSVNVEAEGACEVATGYPYSSPTRLRIQSWLCDGSAQSDRHVHYIIIGT